MRMLMKAQLEVEAANLAIAEGSIGPTLERVFGLCKPEATYFLTENGLRTIYAIFEMTAVEQIPQLAEPLYHGLGATVHFAPVMGAADLQKGLAAWAANR